MLLLEKRSSAVTIAMLNAAVNFPCCAIALGMSRHDWPHPSKTNKQNGWSYECLKNQLHPKNQFHTSPGFWDVLV